MMRRVSLTLAWIIGLVAAFVFVWTRLPITVWYRDGRPTRFGRLTNRAMGRFASLGVPSYSMVTLEVPGRKSGKATSTVLVVARHGGAEYLVSMLGQHADWVRNARAAGGQVTLHHGERKAVRLVEVIPEERAPILKAYLRAAPGARPHIPSTNMLRRRRSTRWPKSFQCSASSRLPLSANRRQLAPRELYAGQIALRLPILQHFRKSHHARRVSPISADELAVGHAFVVVIPGRALLQEANVRY